LFFLKIMKHVILILCVFTGSILVGAQDTVTGSQRKNTIKIDLTSHFLYRNVYGLTFERVTKANQSFVVTAGYQQFPRTSRLGQNIAVKDDRKRNGYKFGGEYRFYLQKENKYLAPRGVYIGPYFMYHRFGNERTIEVDNNGTPEQVLLDSRLSILNIGFQLGYQFVLGNRWTIDLVFVGPSVSNYRYTLELGGTYSFDKEDIQNEIILDLIDRFPLLDEAISNKEATSGGRLDTWSLGYRYQLQVGYHFGRKR
jgi:hypothetical protein